MNNGYYKLAQNPKGMMTKTVLSLGLLALGFGAQAQEGSQGNTTIFGGAQMTFFGNHDFVAPVGGTQPGIILTERATGNMSFLNYSGNGIMANGATDASHVDGYVRKIGTGFFVFPVGDNGNVGQFAASADGTSGAYFHANPTTAVTSDLFTGASYPVLPSGGPFASANVEVGVNNVSTVEYWDIDGATATPLTLTWDAGSVVATMTGSNLSKLTIVGWNPGTNKWEGIASTVDVTSVLGGASALAAGSITTDAPVVPNTFTAYTLAAGDPLDLTPQLIRPISANPVGGQELQGVLRLTNLKASATTGEVSVFLQVGAGFELTVDPTAELSSGLVVTNPLWTITDFGGGLFEFLSKPGTVIAASGQVNLGYTIKATGSISSTGLLTATIINKTGGIIPAAGDENDNNNIAVKTFSIKP